MLWQLMMAREVGERVGALQGGRDRGLAGWRAWGAVSGEFERRLAGQESPAVIAPRIESETRRGKDYVRVTISMTASAPDVAQALTAAWWAFRKAASDDTAGWDLPGATAEVRPGESLTAGRSVHKPSFVRRPANQRGDASVQDQLMAGFVLTLAVPLLGLPPRLSGTVSGRSRRLRSSAIQQELTASPADGDLG
jgi:hypothetical protein